MQTVESVSHSRHNFDVTLKYVLISAFFVWAAPGLSAERVERSDLVLALKTSLSRAEFPKSALGGQVEYTVLDPTQKAARQYLAECRSSQGAVVVMDAQSGAILTLAERGHVFGSKLPAASVIKIVTAAAAIEKLGLTQDSKLRYFVQGIPRETTLIHAFAQSMNRAFSELGTAQVGIAKFTSMLEVFGFNQDQSFEVPIPRSEAKIAEERLGQMSSGALSSTTLSPLHAALLAAAVANGGEPMEPFIIRRLVSPAGTTLYESTPRSLRRFIQEKTALELQKLMKETVISGTASRGFSGFFADRGTDLTVGAKPGFWIESPSNRKTEWFVGFVKSTTQRLAIAVVTVAQRQGDSLCSVRIARKMIETHLGPPARH